MTREVEYRMSHHTLYSDRLELQFHVLHKERERERGREKDIHTHTHTRTQRNRHRHRHTSVCACLQTCACVSCPPVVSWSPLAVSLRERYLVVLDWDLVFTQTSFPPLPLLNVNLEIQTMLHTHHVQCVVVCCSVLQCLGSGNAHINTEISIGRIILRHFAIGPASPPCSIAATTTDTATIASGREGIIIIRYVRASVFVIRVGGGCPVEV